MPFLVTCSDFGYAIFACRDQQGVVVGGSNGSQVECRLNKAASRAAHARAVCGVG